ncbi:MerR family transcriptional regulator [Streptomyces yunnanensis]|uniref:MerR family transcriptional regulator n=1 Tax=Streptomyces yunnanensis TaxID=156453 RepID=UPI0025708538|nr:MerR family transcriptional regulator [Streptomyces yunnanensis]
MAWSTREIAELAGTSLRAVRHYHEVGLLDEPVRRANGYKQYGVAHLVRLLRIKPLSTWGSRCPRPLRWASLTITRGKHCVRSTPNSPPPSGGCNGPGWNSASY